MGQGTRPIRSRMTDRTTINVHQDAHKAAREIKEQKEETWTDVLEFYAEFRSDLSISEIDGSNNGKQDVDIDRLIGRIDDLETELKSQLEALRR